MLVGTSIGAGGVGLVVLFVGCSDISPPLALFALQLATAGIPPIEERHARLDRRPARRAKIRP